jgi:hypothetical protein
MIASAELPGLISVGAAVALTTSTEATCLPSVGLAGEAPGAGEGVPAGLVQPASGKTKQSRVTKTILALVIGKIFELVK